MNEKQEEWKHPELKEGEMFLCNSDIENFALIGWETKRMGNRAFDIYNNIIRMTSIYPVFVQKKEYEEGMKRYD